MSSVLHVHDVHLTDPRNPLDGTICLKTCASSKGEEEKAAEIKSTEEAKKETDPTSNMDDEAAAVAISLALDDGFTAVGPSKKNKKRK